MTNNRKSPRGHIRRRGQRFEVAVCKGRDPITKRYRYAYDSAATYAEAERKRDRLLERLAEGREPDTKATLGLLMDRWMNVAELALSTRETHEGYIERTIRPALGDMQLRKLQNRVDVLDQLYAHLRRCNKLCGGRPFIEQHATKVQDTPHDCAASKCRPHECHPMKPATIRRIHSILNTACGFAIKWDWMDRNPCEYATQPKLGQSEITPPDPSQAAVLLDAASQKNPGLFVYLWLAMTTGGRRGELCPLRWSDIRWEEQDLLIARNYVTRQGKKVIKDTKTHQKRRLALDPATIEILTEYKAGRAELAKQAGLDLDENGYVFFRDGFGADPWLPDTVTHQFGKLSTSTGVTCRLHDLRHYSATQMLANGIDLRTVAGRLGHSGGGATTLKVYAHWTRPADQHAAETLARQLRGTT